MGSIAILLLVFNVILMFTGRIYYNINMIIFSIFVILIVNLVYLAAFKKIAGTFRALKKWFKGEKLEIEDWNVLLINTRQLLVVNYIVSFIIWIFAFLCNIIRIIRIPFEFATYSIQLVILFNGIILAPGYIQLQRRVNN